MSSQVKSDPAILTGSRKRSWSQNLRTLSQKTKIWCNNVLSRRFGRQPFNKFFYYYLHERFQWVVTCNIGKILINGGKIQELQSITARYFVIIQVRDILEKTVVSFLSLFRILLHNKENLLKSTRPMHIKSFFSEYYLSQKSLRMYIIHTHSIVFKAVFKIAFLLLRYWVDFHPEEVV